MFLKLQRNKDKRLPRHLTPKEIQFKGGGGKKKGSYCYDNIKAKKLTHEDVSRKSWNTSLYRDSKIQNNFLAYYSDSKIVFCKILSD